MEKVILIGGQAGQGSAVTSHFIGKIFCNFGYYVFNYRDYPSLIRGGHNFNVLRISDKPVYSHKNNYDIIIALDQKTIDLHQKNLNKDGFILGSKNLKSKKLKPVDFEIIIKKIGQQKFLENNALIGVLFKYFGVDKVFLFGQTEKIFKKKAVLINKLIKEGFELAETKEQLKKQSKPKYFISGSEAIGVGAINGGLDIYFAYPMTPATPVLHFLAKREMEHNIATVQLENEIAVINAALSASFAGARSMIGSSGGGFALMTEGVSLAGMSEVPLVIYLAQRTAPSSGIPTYNTQGDLKFALNSGQGEFPKIVIAPGDAKESIIRTQEALYLSDRYRVPTIILGDKHLGESDYSFDQLDKSSLPNQKIILKKAPKDYKSYQITADGVSPRIVPGQGQVVRATSYEHNEYGNTVEDGDWAVKMSDKRFKKVKYLKAETNKLKPAVVYGKGKNLIIGWGSTKGAIIDALPQIKDTRFLQVSYISPFPKEIVEREIKKSKKVILVENNATGLLGDLITEKTGHFILNKVLKYDARPFTPDIIAEKVGKILKKK